eukprot:1141549-Pelagomonas_calceolata.AAC.11
MCKVICGRKKTGETFSEKGLRTCFHDSRPLCLLTCNSITGEKSFPHEHPPGPLHSKLQGNMLSCVKRARCLLQSLQARKDYSSKASEGSRSTLKYCTYRPSLMKSVLLVSPKKARAIEISRAKWRLQARNILASLTHRTRLNLQARRQQARSGLTIPAYRYLKPGMRKQRAF